MLDIRQFLSETAETCYLTCYHLTCEGVKLNDFVELGDYSFFHNPAVHTLVMEEGSLLYEKKEPIY